MLTVLELLVTVTLDALKQGSEGELLLVAQLGLFLLDHSLHLSFQFVSFELFKEVCLHLDLLSLLVAFHADEFGLFVTQL